MALGLLGKWITVLSTAVTITHNCNSTGAVASHNYAGANICQLSSHGMSSAGHTAAHVKQSQPVLRLLRYNRFCTDIFHRSNTEFQTAASANECK